MTLGPRDCDRTSAATDAPSTSGRPSVGVSPPTTSTSPNWMMSPGSPAIFSTFSVSSATTRYCLPPVLMTANILSSFVPWLDQPVKERAGPASCYVGFWQVFQWPEATKTRACRLQRARTARCLWRDKPARVKERGAAANYLIKTIICQTRNISPGSHVHPQAPEGKYGRHTHHT